jgi:putative membrane protein
MRRAVLVGGLAILCLAPGLALAQQEEETNKADIDQHFAWRASTAGLAEVDLARIAEKQASDPAVVTFARKLMEDHKKASQDLAQLAKGKGLKVAQTLDEKEQKESAHIRQLTGAQFDRAYLEDQVKCHEKAIALFKKEIKEGKDADLQAWAQKMLPTLEEHEKLAKDTESKLKGGTQ